MAHVCPSSSFFHSGAGGRRGGWAKCLTHCKIGLQCSWSTSLVSELGGSSCLLRIHSPIGAVHEVEVPLSLAQFSPTAGFACRVREDPPEMYLAAGFSVMVVMARRWIAETREMERRPAGRECVNRSQGHWRWMA